MPKRIDFIKNTVVGGIVFLIPVIVIVMVFSKASKIMTAVAKPLSKVIPVERFLGIAVLEILALLLVILVCFFAGLVSRRSLGRKIFKSLDENLTKLHPVYSIVKNLVGSFDNSKNAEGMIPVLAKLDDQTQIGFEVERTDNGMVAIFLPGSPNTMSGIVTYMTEDRVERLDIDFLEVNKTLRTLGHGSNKIIK